MSALESLFGWGLATTWQVALLVLAVLAAQRLCRRWLSPRGRYALWLLVVLRLALPALPELPVGLVDWSRSGVPELAAEPARPAILRVVRRDAAPARAAEPEAAAAPAEEAQPATRATSAPRPLVAPPALALDAPVEPPRAVAVPWKALTAGLWLAGALALLARAALRELAFRRRLAAAEQVCEEELVARAARCGRALGLRRPVALLRVDELHAPAVHGWLRPRVLLPASTLARLDPADLERVLRHELAHVRHHDVALAALACALRALWWFHPLVLLALTRLRAAQEALRDWEAVSSEGSPAPLAYARTLLALATTEPAPAPPGAIAFLRRGHDTQERILMIADFRRPGLAAGTLATVLFTTLGLASLTSARAVHPPAGDDATGQEELRHLEVVFHRRAPAWREELERRLDARMRFECEDSSLGQVLEHLRQASGVNIVVAPDVLSEHADLAFAFELPRTSAAEVLSFVCDSGDDLGYCLLREAVYIAPRHALPEAYELRFYKIAPLLEDVPGGEEESATWELIEQLQMLTGPYGEWETEEAAIDSWGDVLVVNQTEAVHARVQGLLDRFLNRGAEPPTPEPTWKSALREKLALPTELAFDDRPVEDALAFLAAKHGLSLELEEDLDLEPITLRLAEVSLGTALDWIAALCDLHVDLRRQGVVLSELSPKELRFYEVGDLFGPSWDVHDEDLRVRVEDTIRYTIDPDSWDADPRSAIAFWGELMLVVQSEPAQQQIAALLDTVRRATARD